MTARTVEFSRAAIDAVAAMSTVGISDLLALAPLQTRVDRKYLVTPEVAIAALAPLADGLRVLEINSTRWFQYESVYFDTPDLRCYRDAAHARRRRFKVRTRTYLGSGESTLEVKTRDGRNRTIKQRQPHALSARSTLDDGDFAFVESILGIADLDLRPSLVTSYRRMTLLDRDHAARLTVDVDLAFADGAGHSFGISPCIVFETKAGGPAVPADRALWRLGARPVPMSKYCVGLAALDSTLPANNWSRVLRRLAVR